MNKWSNTPLDEQMILYLEVMSRNVRDYPELIIIEVLPRNENDGNDGESNGFFLHCPRVFFANIFIDQLYHEGMNIYV